MVFHLIEFLAASPVWLGLCGFGIIVVPIIGIDYIHRRIEK
jgi:hypothetical protein